jgi:hypothetical protein
MADVGTETNPVSVDLDAIRAQLAEWRAAWEAYMFDSVGAVVDVADTLIDEVEQLRAGQRELIRQCASEGIERKRAEGYMMAAQREVEQLRALMR